jgi:four helix bundle protein
MSYVKNFRDLEVYRLARNLSKVIYQTSQGFPKEEMYSLTDQIRRSARSTGAQVAEAWGKRRYEKHFISKLTDADAEQLETQHWIETAMDCEYLKRVDGENLIDQYSILGRMLNSMMSKSSSFCSGQE